MIQTSEEILGLIEEAMSSTGMIYKCKSDFSADFWVLDTGLLGELEQKLVNYQSAIQISGDFSSEVGNSDAFRDYLREAKTYDRPIQFVDESNHK
ncbi:hypothetical protein GCM10009096_01790 [Parasphingorhabdus litoris]|uniref:DUF4180 domain-containing protein n=2 Tax=Parasphingorhabdus litoris TaxID=394733 RepID=A0ABP3JUV4_9SPHN